MQVDHFVAKRGWNESGNDDISNLMPSCRMCNHYKRANSLETFRNYIQEIPRKLKENYIYKVGVVYGNVLECKKPIIFFFEKERNKATPQTRADKIRAMSDDELAEWLTEFANEAFAAGAIGFGGALMTEHDRLTWLQQPCEGGE